MTPEAWAAHYLLWGFAAVVAVLLARRTAARTAAYRAAAFARLEDDRLALARFVSGIDGREAERAAASAARLDALVSEPDSHPVRAFAIHFSLPADTSPADVSNVMARALESLRPVVETARTSTGEPLPVRIEAPAAGV